MTNSLDLKTFEIPASFSKEAQDACEKLVEEIKLNQIKHDKEISENDEVHQQKIKFLKQQFSLVLKQLRPDLISSSSLNNMFDEAEMTTESESEPEIEDEENNSNKKKKKKERKKKKKAIPDNLPRRVVEHDLSKEEKEKLEESGPIKPMGYDSKEELIYTAAKFEVIEHRYPKYSTKVGIKRVKPEPSLIPGSYASTELLAHIAVSKYCDHLPLYRQSEMFSRHGIHITRQVMASWMIKVGEALNPLIGIMHEQILQSPAISADESPVKLLTKDGVRTSTQCYMWQVARWGPKPLIIFEYDQTRRKEVAERLLGDYSGYIQIDGYAGYNTLFGENSPRKRVGCLAHVYRKFKDYLKVIPKKERTNHEAKIIVEKIKALYEIEKPLRGLPAEQRHEQRNKSNAKKTINDLLDLIALEKQSVSSSSPYYKALNYALNELPHIKRYLEDGHIEIDNNLTENSFRKLALGKKNWMFICAERGAQASANIYSVLSTAKANGVEPYSFLLKVIKELPSCQKLEDYEELLQF